MSERKNKTHIRERNLAAIALAGSVALASSVILPPNFPPQPSHSRSVDVPHRRPAKHKPRKTQDVLKSTHLQSSTKALTPLTQVSRLKVSRRNNKGDLDYSGTLYHAEYDRPTPLNIHEGNVVSRRNPLPELVTKYLQQPESFIQLVLNANLTPEQTTERNLLTGFESKISGKFEQRLAHKVAKAFESKLNGQLTLLDKGQIDDKSFQEIMQEQVTGFVDYLKEQNAQGLPNLESMTLAGLLLATSVSVINLRRDFFSHKNRRRLAVALTVLNLIVTACGADQTIMNPGKILDAQGVCTTAEVTSPAGVTAESLLKAQKENPGIYVAGAIFLLGKNEKTDPYVLLERYFQKTIPAQMLTDQLDYRVVYKDLPKNTKEVQNSILRFFLGQGDRSLTWNKVMGVTGETKYNTVLTDISAGALVDGRYSLVGYGTDLWQTRSNIGRSLIVVKNNGNGFEYVLKVQPLSVARTEVNGLSALYRNGISVAPVETYRPSNAKNLSISIQPYIRGGITVAKYLDPRTPGINGVTMDHLEEFYKSIYAAIVREAGAPNQNGKALVVGDASNLLNTIITPEGKLVVIDANAGMHPATVRLIDGNLVSGNKVGFTGIAREVINDFQYFLKVTFGTDLNKLPKISPPKENNLTLLHDLPSKATTNVKFTGPDGTTKFDATVKNSSMGLVTVPNQIPLSHWELLNNALNGALIIVAGASAGYEFVHETGLGGSLVLPQSPSLVDRGRFGLGGQEIDDFETTMGVTKVDTRTLHGWEISLASITDMALPNAEWIDNVREDLNLPKGAGILTPELRLTAPDPLGNSIVLDNVVFGTDTYGPHVKFSFPDCGIKDQRIYIDYGSLAHYTMYTRKNGDDPTSIIKYDEALADYVYHLTSYSDLQKKLTEEMRAGRMLFAVPVKSKDIRGRETTYVVYGTLVEGEDGKPNLEVFFLTSKLSHEDPLYKAQLVVLDRLQK